MPSSQEMDQAYSTVPGPTQGRSTRITWECCNFRGNQWYQRTVITQWIICKSAHSVFSATIKCMHRRAGDSSATVKLGQWTNTAALGFCLRDLLCQKQFRLDQGPNLENVVKWTSVILSEFFCISFVCQLVSYRMKSLRKNCKRIMKDIRKNCERITMFTNICL